MSKKANPNAAFSQTLTAEQKKRYEQSIVQSQDGMFYVFSNKAATVAIINPREVYENFKDFSARVTPEQLDSLYTTLHGKEPTQAIRKDVVEMQVMVWMRLAETSINRLDAKVASAGRGSPKKLENRSYELIKSEIPADLKLPPQAKTCLAFLTECAATVNHNPENGIFSIKETDFKTKVLAEAERLKTRQDPWRIFQYYRPQLIQNGFIRLV